MKTIFKFHFKLIVKGWNFKISQVQSHSVTRKWLWIPCCLASKGREKETYFETTCMFTVQKLRWFCFQRFLITNCERKFAESLNVLTGFILEVIGFKAKVKETEVIYSLSSSPFKIIRGYTSVQMFSFVIRRIRDRVYNLVSRRYWASILFRSSENDNQ